MSQIEFKKKMKNKIVILLSIFVMTLNSCKKKENQTEKETQIIKYTCYSEKGNFQFKYIDKKNNWHDTTINSHSYTLLLDQIQENYRFATQLNSTGPDSVYLKAESDGKKVDHGGRAQIGETINLGVQLTQMK
jgi:hypothetical protein